MGTGITRKTSINYLFVINTARESRKHAIVINTNDNSLDLPHLQPIMDSLPAVLCVFDQKPVQNTNDYAIAERSLGVIHQSTEVANVVLNWPLGERLTKAKKVQMDDFVHMTSELKEAHVIMMAMWQLLKSQTWTWPQLNTEGIKLSSALAKTTPGGLQLIHQHFQEQFINLSKFLKKRLASQVSRFVQEYLRLNSDGWWTESSCLEASFKTLLLAISLVGKDIAPIADSEWLILRVLLDESVQLCRRPEIFAADTEADFATSVDIFNQHAKLNDACVLVKDKLDVSLHIDEAMQSIRSRVILVTEPSVIEKVGLLVGEISESLKKNKMADRLEDSDGESSFLSTFGDIEWAGSKWDVQEAFDLAAMFGFELVSNQLAFLSYTCGLIQAGLVVAKFHQMSDDGTRSKCELTADSVKIVIEYRRARDALALMVRSLHFKATGRQLTEGEEFDIEIMQIALAAKSTQKPPMYKHCDILDSFDFANWACKVLSGSAVIASTVIAAWTDDLNVVLQSISESIPDWESQADKILDPSNEVLRMTIVKNDKYRDLGGICSLAQSMVKAGRNNFIFSVELLEKADKTIDRGFTLVNTTFCLYVLTFEWPSLKGHLLVMITNQRFL